MRLNRQGADIEDGYPEVGHLLLAHPSLRDPNFRRTVVFLAAHDAADGSLGVIMNRATGKTLAATESVPPESILSGIPLYRGGPVASDKLILAAWKWKNLEGSLQLYFGIEGDRAEQLMEGEPGYQVRGFMGYAGWSQGQLMQEVGQGDWLVSPWRPELFEGAGEDIWRQLILHEKPEMRLLLDAPEDPSLN